MPRTSKTDSSTSFKPRSLTQALYHEALSSEKTDIVFATGPAGGGKTHVAVDYALRHNLKIYFVRPKTTTTGRDPGAYQGGEQEKIRPYMKSISSVLPNIGNPSLEALIQQGKIELSTPEHLRGVTLNNGLLLVDEAQNLTVTEATLLITRIGKSTGRSIAVFDGDLSGDQNDLGYKDSGLAHLVCHFGACLMSEHSAAFAFIRFTEDNASARHPLLPFILKAMKTSPQATIEGKHIEYVRGELSDSFDKKASAFQKAAEGNRRLAEYYANILAQRTLDSYMPVLRKKWPDLIEKEKNAQSAATPANDSGLPAAPAHTLSHTL